LRQLPRAICRQTVHRSHRRVLDLYKPMSVRTAIERSRRAGQKPGGVDNWNGPYLKVTRSPSIRGTAIRIPQPFERTGRLTSAPLAPAECWSGQRHRNP
jgi:hypothetical protein